ncbi:MAG: DNA recombination protein RmuC [Bacteroidia bacterium]
MDFAFLLAGVLLGFAIAWLWLRSRGSDTSVNTALEQQLKERDNDIARLRAGVESAEKIYRETKTELDKARENNSLLLAAKTTAESDFRNAVEKLDTQKKELEEIQTRLKTEFKNIANEVLEDKSKRFTEQNKVNLEGILNPLRDRIKDFEEKVDKTYKADSSERISLKEQLKHLTELNKQVSEEANNLVKALKGDSKKQGNWGEMILDKILEKSGLVENEGYVKQFSINTEEGKRYQPDVVIKLPDNKHIIIDAKVSLVAYNACVNAENETDREKYLKEHLLSVRSHIKGLSEKNYQEATQFDTPDFVLLFLPIESSFSIALQGDNELYQYAWDRKIVLVSPTTLLATLRTVASIWKQEKQTKHAIEIAEKAGALYDKFTLLVADLIDVGKKMDAAKSSYSDAMNKLHLGSGNLVNRVEAIKKLGAKATKALPQNLLERSEENAE